MNKKRIFYLFVFISMLGLYSCVDESDFDTSRIANPTVHPTIGVDLVEMDFYLHDFFNFESLNDENEGVCLTVINDENGEYDHMELNVERDFEVDETDVIDFNRFMTIPDISVSLPNIVIPDIPSILLGDGQIITIREDEDLSIMIEPFEPIDQHRKIDSAILANADIRVNGNNIPVKLRLILYSSSIISPEGKLLRDTLTLYGTSEDVLDLNGYTVHVDQVDASDWMKIDLHYKLEAIVDESVIAGTYNSDFTVSFANGQLGFWDIQLAYGKVGECDVPFSDTVYIDYFNNPNFSSIVRPGNFDFQSMELDMDFISNIGVNCFLTLDKLRTENRHGEARNIIDGDQGFWLNRAGSPFETPSTHIGFGPQYQSQVNTSSFEMLPDKLIYDVNFHLSDVDTTINGVHYYSFIYPATSFIKLHTKLKVPLMARILGLTTVKNIGEMDFLRDDGGVGEYIESAELRVDLTNSFPATVKFNIVLRDENDVVYDTILSDPIVVESAKVDKNGKVIGSTTSNIRVTITKEKYEKLRTAPKVACDVFLETGKAADDTHPFIKFEKDAKISAKLGVKVKTNLSVDI